jgi:hypothetical protein
MKGEMQKNQWPPSDSKTHQIKGHTVAEEPKSNLNQTTSAVIIKLVIYHTETAWLIFFQQIIDATL